MQTEFIAVPPFWTVGQAIDYIRAGEDLPDRFTEIFTIDHRFKLAGTLALDRLLRARREVVVGDIHDVNAHPVHAEMDQEEAAQLFEQYDLLSAPVVDENERLVGVLTIDDVVDVIQEEASEDIMRLAGVGDEELSDDVIAISKSRIGWLAVKSGHRDSCLAGHRSVWRDVGKKWWAPGRVDAALWHRWAAYAGTQTMTVAVRALATRDLDSYNTRRIIKKVTVGGPFERCGICLCHRYCRYHLVRRIRARIGDWKSPWWSL